MYIHMNISPKKFLCRCAHSLWNLIVSIGRKYMTDPVFKDNERKCNDLENAFHWQFDDHQRLISFKMEVTNFYASNAKRLDSLRPLMHSYKKSLWFRQPRTEINKTENYSVSCPRRDAFEYIKIEIIIHCTNCSRDYNIF